MDEQNESDRDDQMSIEERKPELEHQPEEGHSPFKGTDTLATTDLEYADREKGKRTTM
jgi:hypothetical protein